MYCIALNYCGRYNYSADIPIGKYLSCADLEAGSGHSLLIIVDLSKIGIGPIPPTPSPTQQSYPSGPLKAIVDPRMHMYIRFGLLECFLFPFSVLWDKNIIIFKKSQADQTSLQTTMSYFDSDTRDHVG